MYQLTTFENVVKRIEDNAFIPFAETNVDYRQYLEWLAEGNEPLPAESAPVGGAA